jgi:aminoglycoside 3-N-acetyltransferase
VRSLAHAILRGLPPGQKQWLKSRLGAARRIWSKRFRAYDPHGLYSLWSDMRLAKGDTVLMHSAFVPTNGFRGKPQDIIDTMLDLIGEEGTLVMMSMAYTSSTRSYLASSPRFDVRRTPSQMGIVSEIFRRRPGVIRSLSPTHPIIALGAKAAWLLEGHERCQYPCGPGSPFEKMLQVDAKMVFFDLPFVGFTFVHYIEHQLREKLSFPLYEPAPVKAVFVDYNGHNRETGLYVFSEEATRRRRVEVITDAMRENRTAEWRRIGNTEMVVANMADALATSLRLAEGGMLPFA